MKDQFVTELATDLFYIRRSNFAKNVNGQTGKNLNSEYEVELIYLFMYE